MNRCYRLVWNRARQLFVVASEISRGRGKAGRTSRAQRLAWLAVLPLSLSPVLGLAMATGTTTSPRGGLVTAGSGAISQSGLTTTINQHSQNLSLNWQSFNVGTDSTVNFVQPNAQSIAVNRIADANGSVILGHVNANGQVFLINPNGVLFGQGAQVNVGGLVASTLNISDRELASGTRHFSGNGRGSVVNQGAINAANGGYIALLGPQVTNQGRLNAPGGTVALAGGNAVTLSFDNNRLLSLQVDKSTLNALADNRQLIVANGGQVLMSAGAKDSLLASVVNNSGTIQAQTVQNRAGKIVLLGGMAAGTTKVAGTLDASAPSGGNGGFIETSAAHVQVADGTRITTLAKAGNAGTWLIDPTDFTIAAGSGAKTSSSIGADTLSSNLGNGNVTIATAASGAENGDIHVNSSVSWSANELTLSAHGDININASLNGSGTAKLALEYGQGAVAAGNTADYHVNAAVNLAAGNNFSTRLGNNGTKQIYTVVTSLGVAADTGTSSLQGIRNNLAGRYVLGSDIDASATFGWNSGAGFNPIGNPPVSPIWNDHFTGSFDGLGHTISGLTIQRTTNYIGLFGWADPGSSIRNVGLLGGSVTGGGYVGGLVALNQGTVSHAYATGIVSGINQVGGLAGQNEGTISHAYATGQVTGSGTSMGGLVGLNKGAISQSYATGTVSGATAYVGGLVGMNDTNGVISQTYATGAVNGGANVGGLVGNNNIRGVISQSYATGYVVGASEVGGLLGRNNSGTTTDSYWATDTTGQNASAGGTAQTLAGLIAAMPAGFNTPIWGNQGNQTTPYLLGNVGPVFIATGGATVYTPVLTLAQLQAIGSGTASLAGSYALFGDIDASATSRWNGGLGFDPIGRDTAFTGIFDGLGHTISGLVIDRPDTSLVGLFSHTGTGSAIRNVGLLGGAVSGLNYVGGLVGFNEDGTITQAYTTGAVTGAGQNIGGLVGQNNYGTINQSYATGAVSGASISVGGLVGYSYHGILISQSYATGAVSGSGVVGGLVGQNVATPISQAYATGTVSGTGADVGGLVGFNNGSTIGQAYATGAVTGGNSVGGLVGHDEFGSITEAYATGGVNGASDFGGLIGSTFGSYTAISNSYWDTYSTGQPGSVGSSVAAGITAITSDPARSGAANYAFKQSAYAGFDFTPGTGAWFMVDGTRPFLQSEYSTTIQNSHQLQLMAMDLAATYTLAADLDISETGRALNSVAPADASGMWSNAGFNPIGEDASRFTGSFDGLGHTLSGLVIDRLTTNYVGLFGYASGSTISNLGLLGGSITGHNYVGGLAGENLSGTISRVYATGAVNGAGALSPAYAGGLVGLNKSGTIFQSYASGAVNGTSNVGGLVGGNMSGGTITQSYATGAVHGKSGVGGLAGTNLDGTITEAYATGAVSGTSLLGGLVGSSPGTVTRSYWAKDTTGQNGSAGGTGLTTAQMMNSASFADWGTDISAVGGSDAAWRIYEGQTGPLLRNFMTALTVTGGNVSATYDGGTGHDLLPGDYAFDIDPQLGVSGTGHYEAGSKNAGSYSNAGLTFSGLYSGQQGYDITFVAGTLTVDKAQLVLSTGDVSKTYDGLLGATSTAVVRSGTLFGSDTLSGGSFAFTDKNAGTGKTVTVSGVSVSDGNSGGNYDVTYADNTASTIIAKAITVGATAANKVYDGTTTASLNLGGASFAGMVAGDDLSVDTATAHFSDRNAANGKTVTINGITLAGADASNYSYNTTAATTANITAKAITVDAIGVDKVYDGGTSAAIAALGSTGLVAGDVITFDAASAAFEDKNAGTGKTVTVHGITATGANAGNYRFSTTANTAADITPATLTYRADGAFFLAGQMLGDLSGAVIGWLGGDTLINATDGTLTWNTPANAASPVGQYAIDGSGLSALNYVFVQAPGNATALRVAHGGMPAPVGVPGLVATTVAGLQQDETWQGRDPSTLYAPNIQILGGGVRLP